MLHGRGIVGDEPLLLLFIRLQSGAGALAGMAGGARCGLLLCCCCCGGAGLASEGLSLLMADGMTETH